MRQVQPQKRYMLGVVLAGLGLLLAACSPAMRQEKSAGSFAWFDLVTESPEVARDFYSGLFGWQFAKGSTDTSNVISGNGELIGGLVSVQGSNTRAESKWVPVLSVDDTMAAVRTASSVGGRLIEQPIQTSDGVFAVIQDNARASVTLYDGASGVPLGNAAKENTWVWVDLLTHNTSGAKRFYKTLAGFETRQGKSTGDNFTVFTHNGKARGGLVHVPRSQVEPNWLPFVLVADLDATMARAKSLGGSVLIREGGTAILLDPSGAAIGVTTREGVSQ